MRLLCHVTGPAVLGTSPLLRPRKASFRLLKFTSFRRSFRRRLKLAGRQGRHSFSPLGFARTEGRHWVSRGLRAGTGFRADSEVELHLKAMYASADSGFKFTVCMRAITCS